MSGAHDSPDEAEPRRLLAADGPRPLVPWALSRPRLNMNARLVLLLIALDKYHKAKREYVRPGRRLLADWSGMHPDAVTKALRELATADLIRLGTRQGTTHRITPLPGRDAPPPWAVTMDGARPLVSAVSALDRTTTGGASRRLALYVAAIWSPDGKDFYLPADQWAQCLGMNPGYFQTSVRARLYETPAGLDRPLLERTAPARGGRPAAHSLHLPEPVDVKTLHAGQRPGFAGEQRAGLHAGQRPGLHAGQHAGFHPTSMQGLLGTPCTPPSPSTREAGTSAGLAAVPDEAHDALRALAEDYGGGFVTTDRLAEQLCVLHGEGRDWSDAAEALRADLVDPVSGRRVPVTRVMAVFASRCPSDAEAEDVDDAAGDSPDEVTRFSGGKPAGHPAPPGRFPPDPPQKSCMQGFQVGSAPILTDRAGSSQILSDEHAPGLDEGAHAALVAADAGPEAAGLDEGAPADEDEADSGRDSLRGPVDEGAPGPDSAHQAEDDADSAVAGSPDGAHRAVVAADAGPEAAPLDEGAPADEDEGADA
ncbi:helix-turn-helix domain-containing protein [Micrococcus sp. FDAARGOS_333]|uniref:helix-turn-helix domain-containing protein n=1 Tax=Micrococcus sp. FDAARGOS_333 TaxID=1930558 RepID=UPI000C9EC285|nr:helix-turn-helix domain-containing protein [Micrococcus sp. FDAARGOS_333]PNL17878.1 hypothetical protein CEQ11_007015 [Micrococcus sp. FDAARGOS_333]